MSAKPVFVTGTDTGVGKTRIATALLAKYAQSGAKIVGMKPVASGSARTLEGLRNEDALALMRQASVAAPYTLVNPYCFEPAIAPHIAAADSGARIELAGLYGAYERLAAQAERVLIEGAGGWYVPINERETLADFAIRVRADIVLVVGIRLGCINHALLTERAITAAGLSCVGWVANTIVRDEPRYGEIVQSLKERLGAPLLGTVPFMDISSPLTVAGFLSLPAETHAGTSRSNLLLF